MTQWWLELSLKAIIEAFFSAIIITILKNMGSAVGGDQEFEKAPIQECREGDVHCN